MTPERLLQTSSEFVSLRATVKLANAVSSMITAQQKQVLAIVLDEETENKKWNQALEDAIENLITAAENLKDATVCLNVLTDRMLSVVEGDANALDTGK